MSAGPEYPRHPVLALLQRSLREWVTDKKMPAGVGFGRALGTGLLMVLAVQACTGMLLALCYSPSPDHAYQSVWYIDARVAGGAFIRGLHHFGSSAIVLLIIAHLARVYFTAAYKHPRQILWMSGVLILMVVGGFSFTGYLLPWDQKAYWATAVGLEIAETVPVLGATAAQLLRGGDEIGALTLTRMYALHVLFLPAALIALVSFHLWLVHKLGVTPPGARVGEPEKKSTPFFPDHVFREVLVGCAAIAIVAAIALWVGPPLEGPASSAAKGYKPRPDWYFLWLFQMLKVFKGDATFLGTAVIPGGIVLGLFLLPWLDRNPDRLPSSRPLAISVGVLLLGVILALTGVGLADPGSKTPRAEEVLVSPDDYQPPPSPPFRAPAGVPPDPLDGSAADPRGGANAAARYAAGLIAEYECTACHTLAGEGDDMGSGAPALEVVGLGRDSAYLHRVVLDPQSVFPESEMPSAEQLELSELHRDHLVRFLIHLAEGEGEFVLEGVEEEQAPDSSSRQADTEEPQAPTSGRDLVQLYECLFCHTLGGEGDDSGAGGPALESVGKDRSAEWLRALLIDPVSVHPDTDMPSAEQLEMGEPDREAIVRFLLELAANS